MANHSYAHILFGICMFLAWRTQLREAQQASQLGRLDEAAQRLVEHRLCQYKPGEDFARQLAAAYLARATRRGEEGNFSGAWHDLSQAQSLAGANEPWHDTHARLSKLALHSLEPLLLAGDYAGAQRRLSQLEKQPLSPEVVLSTKMAIRRLESAANLAKRGDFQQAEEQLAPAIALRPEWNCLCHKLEEVRAHAAEVRTQGDALHTALAAEDWQQTLAVAERLLTLAPELSLAREARKKAKAKVGAKMNDARQPAATPSAWSAKHHDDAGTRFMLWVDAVGGFLVCLADEVWIGQAAPGNAIAAPIQAELARKHAKLVRSGEGYVLEAEHPVSMGDRPLSGKRVLNDGDEFELGRSVRLRFRQPHSLSASARLEILSSHRTQPRADAILLMAESLVLGPKWQDHVICKDWEGDVVLYRQGTDLYCRSSEPVQIDGVTYESRGPVAPCSHVASEQFSFSLEMLT
jgi:tetratricopeptide (TPR) repeat protein